MSESDLKALASALRELLNESPRILTSSQFDKLSNAEKSAHCRAGGKIVDDIKIAKARPLNLAPKTCLREDFDELSAKSQTSLMASGYTILDR